MRQWDVRERETTAPPGAVSASGDPPALPLPAIRRPSVLVVVIVAGIYVTDHDQVTIILHRPGIPRQPTGGAAAGKRSDSADFAMSIVPKRRETNKGDPERMKSIGEISMRRPQAGISGILAAQRAEQGQPQELQHSGPKGKRDRLPPARCVPFLWAAQSLTPE